MTTSFNPFRSKTISSSAEDRFPPVESIATSVPHQPASSVEDAADEFTSERADNDTKGKKKPIKKVRLVTPPPLSPDSPVWPDQQDPSIGFSIDNYEPDSFGVYPPAEDILSTKPSADRGPPPANPFSKTLQDLQGLQDGQEGEAEALKAGQPAKQSLNVDSFRRLLMTGKSSEEEAGPAQTTEPTNNLPAITSPSKDRKLPPPPPSSRHGRTLKTDTYMTDDTAGEQLKHTTEVAKHNISASDENEKTDTSDDASSVFEYQTQPAATPPATQTTAKKPVPAPPPRRGHGRTDTKTNISTIESAPEPVSLNTGEPRQIASPTPVEPGSTRPESIKSPSNAPAPPPPRRPHAAPKQPLSAGHSPSISTSSVPQAISPSPSESVSQNAETPSKSSKVSAPPPPPTRNASSRRPPSTHTDGAGRRLTAESRSRDSTMVPPPPPPRQRGSSPHEQRLSDALSSPDSGKGADILADLDALQREVDALRGKVA